MDTGYNLTSINLEANLIDEAMKISGMTTPQAVIYEALQEFVRTYNNRKKILNYKGKNIWDGNLDEMRLTR
jgi:Arc/MetJ family transcription regulator